MQIRTIHMDMDARLCAHGCVSVEQMVWHNLVGSTDKCNDQVLNLLLFVVVVVAVVAAVVAVVVVAVVVVDVADVADVVEIQLVVVH